MNIESDNKEILDRVGVGELEKYYRGRKVLITGHTGFKGSWLTAWLYSMGAKIFALSDCVPTRPAHYDLIKSVISQDRRVNVRDSEALFRVIQEINPDFLFHLAAQPILLQSYENPLRTFETNTMGTANILEALRNLNRDCIAVMITSDKCYDNLEWAWGYRETDRLGGRDPYSGSKGAAELIIRSYTDSYFKVKGNVIRVGVGRAGNVIGGGDWAPHRIVPDCVRMWAKREIVRVRNPESSRPWQHVLEPLGGYLTLGIALKQRAALNGEAFNFGPAATQCFSVADLIKEVGMHWPGADWKSLKEDNQSFHEAELLKLNCDKALQVLRWQPVLNFNEMAEWTGEWYRAFYQKGPDVALDLTFRQIERYTKIGSNTVVEKSD